LLKKQIPLCISKALAISVSLATIGVCIFSASASVGALFYYIKIIVILLLKQDDEVLIPDIAPEETATNIDTVPNGTATKPGNTDDGSVHLKYTN